MEKGSNQRILKKDFIRSVKDSEIGKNGLERIRLKMERGWESMVEMMCTHLVCTS